MEFKFDYGVPYASPRVNMKRRRQAEADGEARRGGTWEGLENIKVSVEVRK